MSDSLKLTIAYDGSAFFGSQRQSGQRSVQEELEQALGLIAGKPVATVFAGRTDRGVHAVGQVVGCDDVSPGIHEGTLVRAINAHVGDDLSVVRAELVESQFHARFDAKWREYRYRIWLGVRQPLTRSLVWSRHSALDLGSMATAASIFVGTHDVASFASGGEGVPWSRRAGKPRGTVRTITHCSVSRVVPWWGTAEGSGDALEIRVIADGFLPRMVRSMVGALVEIGSGSRSTEWITELLMERDRRKGPSTAPPHGLVLWRVGYGHDVPDPALDGQQVMGASVAQLDLG